MDEALSTRIASTTFNSPLEAGIRAVALLAAAYPRTFDLQRLVAFDYLLVHTGEVGGPESLHPEAPLHAAQLLVRRRLVEHALLLMMTRHLVERDSTTDGFQFRAGENAAPFLEALISEYNLALRQRASWLVNALGAMPDTEFRSVMRRFFDSWVEEFQHAERSLGSDG